MKRTESEKFSDESCPRGDVQLLIREKIVEGEEQKSVSPSQKILKRKSSLNQGWSHLQSLCKEGPC